MIVREKRADIVGAEGERKTSGRAGIGMDVSMSPQSAKMATRIGRWSDVNRECRAVTKKPVEVL